MTRDILDHGYIKQDYLDEQTEALTLSHCALCGAQLERTEKTINGIVKLIYACGLRIETRCIRYCKGIS